MDDLTTYLGIGTAVLTAVVLILRVIPGEQPGETALSKLLDMLKGRKP